MTKPTFKPFPTRKYTKKWHAIAEHNATLLRDHLLTIPGIEHIKSGPYDDRLLAHTIHGPLNIIIWKTDDWIASQFLESPGLWIPNPTKEKCSTKWNFHPWNCPTETPHEHFIARLLDYVKQPEEENA